MQAKAAKASFTRMLLLERHGKFNKQLKDGPLSLGSAPPFPKCFSVLSKCSTCNCCTASMGSRYPSETLSIHFFISPSASRCDYTPTHLFCENCQELHLAWCAGAPFLPADKILWKEQSLLHLFKLYAWQVLEETALDQGIWWTALKDRATLSNTAITEQWIEPEQPCSS